MTDRQEALRRIDDAAARLIPQLSERLARHGLGEIEVRDGGLRVRVSGAAGGPSPAVSPAPADAHAEPPLPAVESSGVAAVGSPAVGFFVYAEGLGPGLEVDKGDALGHVEMLGVRHEVRAPRRGTVRNLVAETGEAVEYGQTVVELDPAESPA